jgi:hypothetical protein
MDQRKKNMAALTTEKIKTERMENYKKSYNSFYKAYSDIAHVPSFLSPEEGRFYF